MMCGYLVPTWGNDRKIPNNLHVVDYVAQTIYKCQGNVKLENSGNWD